MTPFDKNCIDQIKQDMMTYSPDQRRVYTRGLREGIDFCCDLTHQAGFELAKDKDLREFLDYLDTVSLPKA